MFFLLLKTVFELIDFGAFWCFCHFFCLLVSRLPHPQNISHWGLFSPRETNKQKVAWGKIGCIRRVGHGGHSVFGLKMLNTQKSVGRCAPKSPKMKWTNALKESWKKFTEAELSLSKHHNNASWYTDTDEVLLRTLTQLGQSVLQVPALQKIIQGFGVLFSGYPLALPTLISLIFIYLFLSVRLFISPSVSNDSLPG